MTVVCALDLATVTGFAFGTPDEPEPTIGSVKFATAGASADAVFCAALTWAQRFFREHRPDILAIEALLPAEAMRGKTQRHVRDRLAGLHGIIRGAARAANIFDVVEVSVGDIRQHFLGMRGGKRAPAKLDTMRRCKVLGWPVENDNEGDACALWSHQVSRLNPKLALRVSPLFGPKGVAL